MKNEPFPLIVWGEPFTSSRLFVAREGRYYRRSMAKRVRRARRHPRKPSPTSALERILEAPHLERIVPQLQPEVLHRVIQHYGLEDCGPLVALATPGQLARVFDLDLWRAAVPGRDEQFDAGRFGNWLEVMVEAGVSGAAAALAAMDVDLVAAGLSPHVRVFVYAAVTPYTTLDGELASPAPAIDDQLRSDIGGYAVVAKGTDFWEPITTVLTALADAHGTAFDRIMRKCCRLSNSRPEVDGLVDLLTADAQTVFDLAVDRETRRDEQGYVTPAQARAFLQASRRLDLRQGPPARDSITDAYFRDLAARTAAPQDDGAHESPRGERADTSRECPPEAVDAIVDLLRDAGVMPRTPRALLEGSRTTAPRLLRIRTQLQFVHDHAPERYATRTAELAYLSNVIVAGSTIQSRALTADEASNAVVAVCNLGLENWPAPLSDDTLIRHDLVSVFRVGWTVLYENVCMYAAEQLISVVTSLDCADSSVHDDLGQLRATLTKYWRAGTPWEARDAIEVIAVLDLPSWTALLALIDQLPTLHAAVDASLTQSMHQIDVSSFEFISENAQIQHVREFMQLLPGLLRG